MLGDTGTLLAALALYERGIRPRVRDELQRWRALAEGMPDSVLRERTLWSIDGKGSNAEATAVFAILAPRAQRRRVVRASVALQTAVDYLDTLGEQPDDHVLADGLALHGASPTPSPRRRDHRLVRAASPQRGRRLPGRARRCLP